MQHFSEAGATVRLDERRLLYPQARIHQAHSKPFVPGSEASWIIRSDGRKKFWRIAR
jgi:hypothetical protein